MDGWMDGWMDVHEFDLACTCGTYQHIKNYIYIYIHTQVWCKWGEKLSDARTLYSRPHQPNGTLYKMAASEFAIDRLHPKGFGEFTDGN